MESINIADRDMLLWAGSPNEFHSVGIAIVFGLYPVDGLGWYYVDSLNGAARGVVSLSSESKLLGSGTYNDVYTVN